MQFLIYGEDTYRSKNALTDCRERFRRERDPQGMNVTVLDADVVEVAAVHEAVLTPPFLAEKKMVILRGFLLQKKEIQEQMLELSARVPECCVAVWYEVVTGEELEKSVLFEMLREQKGSNEFHKLSEREAMAFVVEEMKKCGVQVGAGISASVVQRVGVESWLLATEAKKLAMYARSVGRAEVLMEDVAAIVNGDDVDEAKVFDFTDAYVRGDVGRSLRLFRLLVQEGSHPLQLTSLLLKQFRALLAIRDALDRGLHIGTAVASLKLHSFVAMKSQKVVERMDMVQLREMYGRVIAFDAAMKSSAVDPEDALCASFVEDVSC